MSIHKEKLSFLCFLRSSLSDRFNFFVVSSLHECSVISTISSLHHSILHTIHVTIVIKSYQRVMGAFTCGVPIFCMGAYKHNAVVAIKLCLLYFFPRVLLISVPARTRVQFEGGNKTRAGSISLGSAYRLEC